MKDAQLRWTFFFFFLVIYSAYRCFGNKKSGETTSLASTCFIIINRHKKKRMR